MADLNRAVGHPPATTMRAYLKGLTELEVLERRQEAGFPGPVAYVLTPSGEKLLAVAAALQDWLREAPDGPIALGSPAAKSATKALVEGWNTTLVRVLAARPFALTELARLLPGISYPTLERRVAAMRRVGLLQACRGGRASRGTPYEATPWLRKAVAPLAAAVAWERRCAPSQTKAIGRLDVEGAFLLAASLLDLPPELSGVCRLGVEMRSEAGLEYAGVMVTIERGSLLSCSARLKGQPDGWATGGVSDWFGWSTGNPAAQLEFGGDVPLARIVAEAMNQALLSATPVAAS